MGWCSGTEVFDAVLNEILDVKELSDKRKKKIIEVLVDVLKDQDWDCEPDSEYWDHPLVRSVFMDLYPDMFEDDE
jgi:hypothetical protein